MSRVGRQQITVPEKTDVSVENGVVSVKGPLGELSLSVRPEVSVSVEGGEVKVVPNKPEGPMTAALWGTYASHIANMIRGVNAPYEKKLIIEGVGYKASVTGDTLSMQLGFSHPVEMKIPDGITVSVEKNEITVSGIDKEAVGRFASDVRAKRKPEPYKGKGIRYENEIIRRKQGKKAV